MRTVNQESTVYPGQSYQTIMEEELSSLTLFNHALSGSAVVSSSYLSVEFTYCHFFACTFKEVIFVNCTFKDCDFQFSHIYNCHFINCNFINCKWTASSTKETQYLDCELDPVISCLTESGRNEISFSYSEDSESPSLELLAAQKTQE